MFGRKQQVIVELRELTELIDRAMARASSSPHTTTVTINIQEMHIHQAGSGYQAPQIEQPMRTALPAPSTIVLPDNYRVGPTDCPACGRILQPGEGNYYHGRYYHDECAAQAFGMQSSHLLTDAFGN